MRLVTMAVVIFSVFTSGCAAIWPSLKSDEHLINNKDCSSARPSLELAEACLTAARREMGEAQQDIDRYNRGLGYTAVVGGTYAGVQALKNNLGPIKYAAVALAALVGIDKVVDSDHQANVLAAGAKALRCVAKAEGAALGAHDKMKQLNFSESIFSASQEQAIRGIATTGIVTATEFKAQVLAISRLQAAAIAEFERAVKDNADTDVLARRVLNSVQDIRSTVREQLAAKHQDPAQAYKDQQESVKKIVGEQYGAAKKAQMLGTQAAVYGLTAGSTPVPDQTQPGAKEIADVYEDCVIKPPADSK